MRRLFTLASRLPAPIRRALRAVPGVYRLRSRSYGRPAAAGTASGEARPVVYLPTWLRWDQMRQRPQNLLSALGRAGHPVYFVDPYEPAGRRDGAVRIVPDLGAVPGRDAVLYVHFAPLRALFDRFDNPVIVYDILDDLSIYAMGERGLARRWRVASHHPALMEEADVVMASIGVLAGRHRAERPDLLLVENGVEFERFARRALRPADLPPGNGPLVGFHGSVARWFDFELLEAVAGLLSDWRFVVIGPVEEKASASVAALRRVANLAFLGERGSDTMPGYVQAFDIGAIWFRVNELTRAVNPLKMFEYLAAGKPVVATSIPACVANPLVRTAGSPEAFAAALRQAAGEARDPGKTAARRAAAAAADWSARIVPLLDRLNGLGVRYAP